MQIHRAIIHHLKKEKNQTQTSDIDYRESDFNTSSPTLISFGIEIQKAYKKKSKATGRFDTNMSEYPFQKYLIKFYKDENGSVEAFIEFSKKSMVRLQNEAKKQPQSSGGYVLFFYYEVNQRHYMMVMLLSQKVVFNVKDLDLKNLEAIDLETFRYAVRIDLNKWSDLDGSESDEEMPYLTFLRGRTDRVSDYFQSFIGCTDYSPSKQSTEGMIKAVRKYLVEKERLDTDARRDKEKELLDYCVNKLNSGELVSLVSVSSMLNPEESEKFINYIDEEDLFFPEFFEANRTSLRELKSYHYKDKCWELRFDHTAYKSKVVYDSESKTITIRDVPEDFAQKIDIVE